VIQSGKEIAENQLIQSQVCIIGAGAAGVTLTLELARKGIGVVLLEAGGLDTKAFPDQDLEGNIVDAHYHAPLPECRSRQLGGTTALWAGRCMPMDPIDFARRDYVQNSGWPIQFEELAGFYPLANKYCHVGSYDYEVSQNSINVPPTIVPDFIDDAITNSRLERWSLPTHFGKHYRKELIDRKNVRLLTDSFCINVELHPARRTVDAVTVATAPGRHYRVKAQTFIIAGGGLETTRLLLASNTIDSEGIGNTYGQLGRYYMGHLFGSIAEINFAGDPRKTRYGFERDKSGVYYRRRFWISPETQKKEKILNTVLWLTNPPAADPNHCSGILSAAYLALAMPVVRDKLAPLAIQKAFRGQSQSENYWPHLRNILLDFPHTAFYAPQLLFKRLLPNRRIPALFIYSRFNRYDLYYHAEQTPQWDNRVSLEQQRDRFGMPRLQVNFRYNAQDIESVCRAHEVLADQLESRQKLGTLKYKQNDIRALIVEQARDGFHQLGTTRMSFSEKDGVVDPDCKVHSLKNLYLCSSSVFPTSGQANPTLTIVALAVRLANHLLHSLSHS
jgi:choline dehydrogenase-like flavoprotein